jgi:hypothetical protein
MAYSGPYQPKNPAKYHGDPRQIVYRSLWERQVMETLDLHPDIVAWGSETVIVPYRSPVDRQVHRYFVDFWLRKRSGEEILIEVKPLSQTKPPVKPKRITRKWKEQVVTYAINERKWEAARAFAEARGMTFQLITERELGLIVG